MRAALAQSVGIPIELPAARTFRAHSDPEMKIVAAENPVDIENVPEGYAPLHQQSALLQSALQTVVQD